MSATLRLAGTALSALEKELKRQERKVRVAGAIALTKTAKRAETEIRAEMVKVFNAPTRWTLNGLFIKPARKNDLTAIVKLKDDSAIGQKGNTKGGVPAVKFLYPQIFGGPRNAKGYELKLRALGILGRNEFTVPGQGIRLNKFGNITRAKLSKMIADVQVSRGIRDGIPYGFGQGTTTQGKRKYFYNPNKRPRAIYERFGAGGRRIRPFLFFVNDAPNYKARLDFNGIAVRTFDRWINAELDKANDFVRRD